jgi:hypothetical protein
VLKILRNAAAVVCVLSPLSVSAQAPKQYLCIADSITGFVFEKGRWISTEFRASEGRWIVYKEELRKAEYSVKRVGEDTPEFFCVDGFDRYGGMSCRPVVNVLVTDPYLHTADTFSISRETGRFLTTAGTRGYWRNVNAQADAKSASPHIAIGKCSAF